MTLGVKINLLKRNVRLDLVLNSNPIFLIYLFLTVLGLHCCLRAIFSFREQGRLSSCGAQASQFGGSLIAEHRLSVCMGFSSCGAWV